MSKLTKRFVETLTIKKSDYIVFDSDVSGFGVRVLPSGKKSYMIQYRAAGPKFIKVSSRLIRYTRRDLNEWVDARKISNTAQYAY